jgi:hypothetical protein
MSSPHLSAGRPHAGLHAGSSTHTTRAPASPARTRAAARPPPATADRSAALSGVNGSMCRSAGPSPARSADGGHDGTVADHGVPLGGRLRVRSR